MNLIIRILAVLLALLVVAFATVLLITPQTVADAVERLEDVSPIARIAAVIILYLIGLAIITLRFRSRPRTDGDMLYVRAAGAQAALTVASVRERILKSVGQVPGVDSVEAELKSINGRADVELHVATTDDRVNIPEKQREIYRTLEQVIKKQLGVELANRPRVNIQLGRVIPSGTGGMVTPPPTSATSPAPVAPVVPTAPMVTPAAVPVGQTPAQVNSTSTVSSPVSTNSGFSDAKPNAHYGVSTDTVSASSTFTSSAPAVTSPVNEFDDDFDVADPYDDEPDFMAEDDDQSDQPRSYSEPL